MKWENHLNYQMHQVGQISVGYILLTKKDRDCVFNRCHFNLSDSRLNFIYRLRSTPFFDCSDDDIASSRVSEMTDLGVVLDPRLCFRAHIDKKVANAWCSEESLRGLRRIEMSDSHLQCSCQIASGIRIGGLESGIVGAIEVYWVYSE